jgi:hypothetical protein
MTPQQQAKAELAIIAALNKASAWFHSVSIVEGVSPHDVKAFYDAIGECKKLVAVAMCRRTYKEWDGE